MACSLAVHSPYFYCFKLLTWCDKFYCIKNWEPLFDHQMADKIYTSTVLVIFIYVPLTLIFILYTSIFLVLRKRKALLNHLGDEANARRRKQNTQIIRMSLCIVVAFADKSPSKSWTFGSVTLYKFLKLTKETRKAGIYSRLPTPPPQRHIDGWRRAWEPPSQKILRNVCQIPGTGAGKGGFTYAIALREKISGIRNHLVANCLSWHILMS